MRYLSEIHAIIILATMANTYKSGQLLDFQAGILATYIRRGAEKLGFGVVESHPIHQNDRLEIGQ